MSEVLTNMRRRFTCNYKIGIHNNEIWYTSFDGNIVTPYKTNVFGANITSNIYTNGVGIIVFDSDVTTIGDEAFYKCSSLTSVTIPDSVTTIGDYAFEWCENLTSVTIPDSVTTIGDYAFYYCISLTSVTIPDSVTTIGYMAFYQCLSLTSVTIPDSVTTIGNHAFYNCHSLTSIYCKAITPPTGGYAMFDSNASDRKIYVPMESVEAYKLASWWSSYTNSIEGYNF